MNAGDLDRLPVEFEPAPDAFATSPAGRFAARHGLADFAALARRADEDPAWYWQAGYDDVGIRWLEPYDTVEDLRDGPQFPHYFRGGRLNWADYAVDRWVDEGRGGAEAVWWEGDDGTHRTLSYAQLQWGVNAAAGAFRDAGIAKGDPVALLLPMIPEAIMAVLGAAKIGAVIVPMFTGYGAGAVRERLEDSGAKLVVTCDAFPRRGRPVGLKDIVDAAAGDGVAVNTIFVVRRLGVDVPMTPGRDHWWDEVCDAADPVERAERMDSEDPCILLFTSGSTGRPKGCVHTHAGLPAKVALEARHALSVDETSRVLWLTDMGWIMGSFLITAALTNGATAVFFEGTPDHPEPDRLWAVAERSRTTVLGVSPTVVRALMGAGEHWPQRHELAALRAIGSTGEPWNIEPWRWCFANVGKGRVPIVNITGGTEIGGALVTGATYLPAKPASFNGPVLGIATDVVDPSGRAVRGEIGELVVRRPWPGMTKAFWEGRERFLETYWQRFPDVWHHGDLAYVDADGFWFLLGRSDDTINVAGKRVGPAEVESVVVQAPGVLEAAAVGVPDAVKGEALVCFVVLSPGGEPAQTVGAVQAAIIDSLGKPLAPREIHVVPALPKTRNGKVMRRVARAVYVGENPGDLSALDDPAVLETWPAVEARQG